MLRKLMFPLAVAGAALIGVASFAGTAEAKRGDHGGKWSGKHHGGGQKWSGHRGGGHKWSGRRHGGKRHFKHRGHGGFSLYLGYPSYGYGPRHNYYSGYPAYDCYWTRRPVKVRYWSNKRDRWAYKTVLRSYRVC